MPIKFTSTGVAVMEIKSLFFPVGQQWPVLLGPKTNVTKNKLFFLNKQKHGEMDSKIVLVNAHFHLETNVRYLETPCNATVCNIRTRETETCAVAFTTVNTRSQPDTSGTLQIPST